jgi:two-component system copper resistance phosphate regulon response regulator CusR
VNDERCAVLIIEDDEKMQDMLRTMLATSATSIDTAADGERAIEMLHAGTYDIVILDLMLPKKNGLVVAETVASLPYRPGLIVLSAISRYFQDRFPAGTRVLQKPFEIDKLSEAVASVRADVQRDSLVRSRPAS